MLELLMKQIRKINAISTESLITSKGSYKYLKETDDVWKIQLSAEIMFRYSTDTGEERDMIDVLCFIAHQID